MNATVEASVEPGIRDEAEAILARLGIPVPEAVGLFFRQVVQRRGLPFAPRPAYKRPLFLDELDEETLLAEVQKGLDDIEAGRVTSLADFRRELELEGRI
jgi:addiction module RelB/DinJ family antitoxin